VQFQVYPFNTDVEATTWSIADTDRGLTQLQRENYSFTSKDKMRFTMEFSIRLAEFEASWLAIGVLELWKAIEKGVYYFGYAMMHVERNVVESIQ
jgi:hypothetical protein